MIVRTLIMCFLCLFGAVPTSSDLRIRSKRVHSKFRWYKAKYQSKLARGRIAPTKSRKRRYER